MAKSRAVTALRPQLQVLYNKANGPLTDGRTFSLRFGNVDRKVLASYMSLIQRK